MSFRERTYNNKDNNQDIQNMQAHAGETQAKTTATKHLVRTNEMRILRAITEKNST